MNAQMFSITAHPDTGRRIGVIAAQIAQTFTQFIHSGIDNRQMQRRNPFNRFCRPGQAPFGFKIPVRVRILNQAIFISADIHLVSDQFKFGFAVGLFDIYDLKLFCVGAEPTALISKVIFPSAESLIFSKSDVVPSV